MFNKQNITKSLTYKIMTAVFVIAIMIAAGVFVQGSSAAPKAVRYVNASTGVDTGDCISVAAPCATITYAINQSLSGDVIQVAAGTYSEALNIDKNLSIYGAGETSVTIDTSGTSSYGIYAHGDITTSFYNFTLIGPPGATNGYGMKISGEDAIVTISHVTVKNSGRSGIDLNGVNGGTLTGITVQDNGGVGLALTDTSNVTVENITTSGNVWGGVGIYTYGRYYTGGSDNITFQGTNSYGEANPLYTEVENYNNPANPYPITNFSQSDFRYTVNNDTDAPNVTGYQQTLANAVAAALAAATPDASYITDLDNGNFMVAPGMSIQAAVDAAEDGDVIQVLDGTYVETVTVDGKDITIKGDGSDTIIQAEDAIPVCTTTSYDWHAIICVLNDADFTLKDFTVDGAAKGNANYKFMGVGFRNAGGTVENVDFKDIRNEPFSGAQHGVGINVWNDDAVGRDVNVLGDSFVRFQKNAMALNAQDDTPLTVDVEENTITGYGTIPTTAQNGIQVWAPLASGKVISNTVSGIAYDGTSWVATSILLYSGDTYEVKNNTVTDAQVGIYNIDANGDIENNTISVAESGDYSFGIVPTDPPEAHPAPFGDGSSMSAAAKSSKAPAARDLTVTVNHNTILYTGADNTETYGLDVEAGWGDDNLSFTALYNKISGFEYGVALYQDDSNPGVFTDATLNYNCLESNDYGLWSNITDFTVDATRNYWGDANGPDTTAMTGGAQNPNDPSALGGIVEGDVEIIPWYATCTTSPTTEYVTVYEDDTMANLIAYSDTVQGGVDAPPDDGYVVASARTFEESVVISRSDILLEGAGVDTVIKAEEDIPTCVHTNYDWHPVVCVKDVSDVAIQNLTIDGAGRGNNNYRFFGIAYYNVNGDVEDVVFKDVRDTPFSGAQHGLALYEYSDDGNVHTFTAKNNTVTGFQKNAITLNAAGDTPLVVDVEGNTITGVGATDVIAQNGIEIWADSGSGTIASNTISGIGYDNTDASVKWVGTSILNIFADLDILNNTITGAQMGMYNWDGNVLIDHNDVSVEKIGISSTGINAEDPPNSIPSPFGEGEELPMPGEARANGANAPSDGAGTLDVEISYNKVKFVGTDYTETFGIRSNAGYGESNIDLNVHHNQVNGFDKGVMIHTCEADWLGCSISNPGQFVGLTVVYNCLADNQYGIFSDYTHLITTGQYNWWGDATGPFHPVDNPSGLGSQVSNYVDFEPWDAFGCGGFHLYLPFTAVVH